MTDSPGSAAAWPRLDAALEELRAATAELDREILLDEAQLLPERPTLTLIRGGRDDA